MCHRHNRAEKRKYEKDIASLTARNLELTEKLQKLTSNDTFRAIDIDRKEELCRCDRPSLRNNSSSDNGYTQICTNCGGWR